MEETKLIYEIITIFVAGFIGGYIAIKLKQPVILGYILAGALLTLPLVKKYLSLENSEEIAEVGAGLLLFSVGVEFSLKKIEKIKKIVIIGAVLQILFTILISFFLFQLFNFSSFEAFFIGCTVSLSSTVIVIKLLESRQELETKSGSIMLGWLILQDIAVVFIVILLQNSAKGGVDLAALFNAIIKSFALIALALILGKTLVPFLLMKVAKLGSREILLIVSFLLPLILAVVAEKLGLSFTLGAFLAGLMISESFVNHEIFSEVRPVRDIFSLIFFITIGSLFSLSYFFGNIIQIILITLLILIIKVTVILIINTFINKLHPKISFRIAFGLVQIGEFAFLISKILHDNGSISNELNSLIISITVISFILSPFLLDKSGYFYDKAKDFIQKYNPQLHRQFFLHGIGEKDVDQPEFSDHIVLCGYGRVGMYVGQALHKLKTPFIAIEIDSEKVEKIREEGIKIIYGDATNKEILDAADVERASTIVLALPKDQDIHFVSKIAKEINPKIKVIARASVNESSEVMHNNGIDTLIDPEFEAALSLVHSIVVYRGEKNKKILYWLRSIKELNALNEDVRSY